jgi:hypothetical protein
LRAAPGAWAWRGAPIWSKHVRGGLHGQPGPMGRWRYAMMASRSESMAVLHGRPGLGAGRCNTRDSGLGLRVMWHSWQASEAVRTSRLALDGLQPSGL